MGRSNSSGVGTHTDGDGNLITIDENGSHVLLGQDEDAEPTGEPAEDAEPEDEKTPPESEQDPEQEDSHRSSEDPAGGGFLIPELIVDHPPNEHEAE